MKAVLSRLQREYGWNERILTDEDFERICQQCKIEVLVERMRHFGAYLVCENVPFIFLKKNLSVERRRFVQWHELAHHFLHAPGICFFVSGTTSKAEFQADALASCALIPRRILTTWRLDTILSEYEYSKELLSIRIKTYQRFGL